jgi:hypothetical protein
MQGRHVCNPRCGLILAARPVLSSATNTLTDCSMLSRSISRIISSSSTHCNVASCWRCSCPTLPLFAAAAGVLAGWRGGLALELAACSRQPRKHNVSASRAPGLKMLHA